MKTPGHYRIKIIFLLATVVLLSLSIYSYVRINRLINTTEMINHNQAVRNALEKTFTELLQAETAQRGYIHTRDSLFFNEMQNALVGVDLNLQQVDSLTIRDSSLRENVHVLKAAVNAKILYMENLVSDAIENELPTARWIKGKELMGEVRVQSNLMQEEQEALLTRDAALLDKDAYFTPLVSFILISCSLIFLVRAYFWILAELKTSDKLRTTLEHKQGELELTNTQLVHRNEEVLSAIARIKQNEKALKNQTRQLEDNNQALLRLNKELELFNYISSHDLQEPLRKIQIFGSRIQTSEEKTLSTKGKEDLHRMQDAAHRMQMLIEDLLAYSRTTTTERILVKTDLRELTEEVKTGFEDNLQNKSAQIDITEMCEAKVIPFQFRQLMQNLISNAIKFSKPNQPAQIRITSNMVDYETLKAANLQLFTPGIGQNGNGLGYEATYCHISVCDNGIGFEPAYKERIFEIFQRLHTNAAYQGTGIGLAIVKKIIDNHNGVITATGNPDKGACFDMYIPA